MLDVLDAPRSLHSVDGGDLVWVGLDPPMRHQEIEELPGGYVEDALFRVELKFD